MPAVKQPDGSFQFCSPDEFARLTAVCEAQDESLSMDDLIQELWELGNHPCRSELDFGGTLRQAAYVIAKQRAQLATMRGEILDELMAADADLLDAFVRPPLAPL